MNERVRALHQSSTLHITALTKKLLSEGKDVVNFAAGEPDFDTPLFVKECAKKAIDRGATKYTPSCGTIELRELIARKLSCDNHIPVKAKNIIVTAGAKYAIFAAMMTALNPGDEVIIPAPYWVSYPEMCTALGVAAVCVAATQQNNFCLTPEALMRAITPKTRMIILNYPNNPTGATYDRAALTGLLEVIRGKNIYVLSDEIYETLVYDGKEHTSFASLPGAADCTITINGFSKAFSMTGWRLGYLAAHDDFVAQASKVIDHTTSCCSSISQAAAVAVFDDTQWAKDMAAEFSKRRAILFEGLSACKTIRPIKPQGTFYMFCDIRSSGLTSMSAAQQLLEKKLVSVIPADSFGAEGYIRLSFATSTSDIKKGIERLREFFC